MGASQVVVTQSLLSAAVNNFFALPAPLGNQSPDWRRVCGGRYGHQQLALHSSRGILSHALGVRLLGGGKLRSNSSGAGHVWQRAQKPV